MSLLNKHIVAIDDTHSILTFLRISLEAHGATFHGAATAAGGMTLCETEHPDLVVLDLGLPDKEGLNILPRLKRLTKEKKVPVVVLTAHREQEAMKQALELGADAYITKPFVMEELIDIIRNKLQLSRGDGDAQQDQRLTLVKNERSRTATRRPTRLSET